MILGSKEIFIPKYVDGTKIHSIREGERWREGMSIQYFTNVRTKNMRKFMADGVCKGVQEICMTFNGWSFRITVDNSPLYLTDKKLLAQNDGFDNEYKMLEFFFQKGNKDFIKGQIVHWTDFKYTY